MPTGTPMMIASATNQGDGAMNEEFIGSGYVPAANRRHRAHALVSREQEIEESMRLILGTASASGQCGRSSAARFTIMF